MNMVMFELELIRSEDDPDGTDAVVAKALPGNGIESTSEAVEEVQNGTHLLLFELGACRQKSIQCIECLSDTFFLF